MGAHGRTAKILVSRFAGDGVQRRPDEVIVEEPLEIRLDGVTVATTMRTPGHDFELASGLCFSEGLLGDAVVQTCRYCGTGSAVETEFNVVSVETGGRATPPTPRLSVTTSACGLCGSAAIDQLVERLQPLVAPVRFDLQVLASVPERVRREQPLFEATGAVHAAATFDASGGIGVVREDIGRHNAVDKVVGRLLLDDALPARRLGLYVSGRASFEMVQKAWAAGFAAVVAVSAPSALAVDVARRANLQLAGFAREGELNVYSGDD
jgi:FdhD protein